MDIAYNLTEVRKLLSDFYILTDFRVALFDKNFQELYAYPSRFSNFCKTIRTNETLLACCKRDDLLHFEQCKQEKHAIVYTCHAGLYEVIAPIIVNETVVGYIMAGQIYGDNCYLSNFDKICAHFMEFNLDLDALSKEYLSSNQTSLVKLEATKHLMQVCAEYLCNVQAVSLNTHSLAHEIDQFVLENMTRDLSVAELCETFHYHKTRFYQETNAIFGMTVTRHIRQLRIYKAKELLSNTSLKISDIASAVGMPDYNYFTKVFKCEVGCIPREFRKNSIASLQGSVNL
ncbi:MAG: PocR ligand-binding domain-containing protein [Faecalibacterium sp.]